MNSCTLIAPISRLRSRCHRLRRCLPGVCSADFVRFSREGKAMASPLAVEEQFDAQAVAGLMDRVRGPVLTPGGPGYDEARSVWNGLIDRRPALIVQCSGAADVVDAVSFAREHGLVLSIKAGGHG